MVAVDDDGDFLFGFVFEDRLISLRDGAMMQLDAMMLLLVVAVVVAGAVVAVIIVCCCWCCWFFVAAVVADAASAVFCSVLFLKIFLLLLLALLLNKRGLNLQTWHLIKYIPRLESVLYRDVYVCVLFFVRSGEPSERVSRSIAIDEVWNGTIPRFRIIGVLR